MVTGTMDYFDPKSISEAISILSKWGERARIIAGGTDVMVDMKHKEEPVCLVNIKRIPNMSYIKEEGGGLRMGPLTTIREIETSRLVRERFPVLWEASRQFASLQIRNTATIGGNICRASPSGEMLAPLLVLEAKARIVLPDGERIVPFDTFFIGPGKTVLGSNGLLKEIEIPTPPKESCSIYLKHAVRGAMDIAIVSVAVLVTSDSKESSANDVRIGLGAVAPTPIRAKKAEAILRGKSFEQRRIGETAIEAAAEAQPITDQRGTAEYRKWIVEALIRRGLNETWKAKARKGRS